MSTSITRRGTALLVAATISLLAALATASQAGAATYYACVKKNGSARIYSKKPKCRRGESKLSWNNVGPAGRNGLNGANGANGKNGANGTNGSNGKEGPPGPANLLVFSPLSLQNGWVDTLSLYDTNPVGFARDGFGVVHLRGGVANGTANPIGTLPLGDRPLHEVYAISWGFNAESPAFVRIDPSGEIFLFDQGGTVTKVKAFGSLEGVTFFAG